MADIGGNADFIVPAYIPCVSQGLAVSDLVSTIPAARVMFRSWDEDYSRRAAGRVDVRRTSGQVLAGSRKAEARMRDRARIVLLASAGMASRAIAREVGCTPGTASKWRVRYARARMAGLSETGDRGNEPKYGPERRQHFLALLDQPPPAGYSNWTAPFLDPGKPVIARRLVRQRHRIRGPHRGLYQQLQ
jgi:hypothetical protein